MATAIHQYEDKLLDFAYGELPAPEASAVESHLKSCARCTQALDQIRGVRATMSALPQEPAPSAGLESLLAYAEQAAARHAAEPRAAVPWWKRMIAPLAGACALTLVAVVAVKTQDDGDLSFSAEQAALDATPRKVDERYSPPSPVAAAPAPQKQEAQEPQKVAEKMKSGKTAGAVGSAMELERASKEGRAWDTADQNKALAKNRNDGYSQAMGETKAPERQQAQRDELGAAITQAGKGSKTRREANAPTADFGNARGAYVQTKTAEESKKKSAPSGGFKGDSAGPSTAANKPAPPPKAAMPAPIEAAPEQVAEAEPEAPKAEAPRAPSPKPQKSQPSIGLSMGSSSAGGSMGTGRTAAPSPSRYKQNAPSNEEDDVASRGVDSIADRKRMSKDVDELQRDQELAAKGYLDAARSASNSGNRQEEVKQAMAALQTGVKGASRAEALNRLCTALDALGNEGQADKYCGALVQEFPTTAAARLAIERRSSLQQRPAAKSSDRSSEAESADKPAPVQKKAAPADARPASAY